MIYFNSLYCVEVLNTRGNLIIQTIFTLFLILWHPLSHYCTTAHIYKVYNRTFWYAAHPITVNMIFPTHYAPNKTTKIITMNSKAYLEYHRQAPVYVSTLGKTIWFLIHHSVYCMSVAKLQPSDLTSRRYAYIWYKEMRVRLKKYVPLRTETNIFV